MLASQTSPWIFIKVLEDGTLVLRRLDSRGAGRYACRVETGVTKNPNVKKGFFFC